MAAPSLDARLRVVCDRAMVIVGGAGAAIELTDRGPGDATRRAKRGDAAAGADPARVPIPSRTGAGILEVWPPAGGLIGPADRAVLGQLALLASGAIDD